MNTTALDARRIAIVGIGNAGGHWLARVSSDWAAGPVLAALNTDRQALESLPVPVKIVLGAESTRGLGAAGDPGTGRMAIEDCPAEVSALFDDKSLVILLAGLGGGTGTGAAPVAARLARAAGALVLAVVTLPFEHEGPQVQQMAAQGLAALRGEVDGVVVIPNPRLFAGVEGTAEAAFQRANETLMAGVSGIWRLLVHTGYMAVTFADLRTVLRHSGGTLVFGCGWGEGSDRAEQAVRQALQDPLLEGGEVLGRATSVLVSVAGGHDVTYAEISRIMTAVQAVVSKETQVRLGPAIDSGLMGRLQVTILASEAWGGRRSETLRPAITDPKVPPSSPRPAGVRPAPAGGGGVRVQQSQMVLETVGKGRFKGVEPTIVNGENLDVPTFERRGIPIHR